MEPNYYPGKPPEEQPEPIKWAGREPTEEELAQILADHAAWVEDSMEGRPPHDLSMADLSGADLRRASLSRVRLTMADLSGAELFMSDLRSARLSYANLEEARLHDVDLRDADLGKTNFTRAELAGARFKGAMLTEAVLHNTMLIHADFRGAKLYAADFSQADVLGIRTNRRTKFQSVRGIDSTFGSAKFRDRARHQEFLEEMRETFLGKVLYWPWLVLADCGRTPWPWLAWCLFFVFGFAWAFFRWVGPASFDLAHLPSTFQTMLYYSVVTFTTLGFGDVVPKTNAAAWWVMAEVIVGYIMLGGLISIFATKLVARRG